MKYFIILACIVSNSVMALDPCDPGSFTSDVDEPVKRLAKIICYQTGSRKGIIKEQYREAFKVVRPMCSGIFSSCESARLRMLHIAQTQVPAFAARSENQYLYVNPNSAQRTEETLLLSAYKQKLKHKTLSEGKRRAIKEAQAREKRALAAVKRAQEALAEATLRDEDARSYGGDTAADSAAKARRILAGANAVLSQAKAEVKAAKEAITTSKSKLKTQIRLHDQAIDDTEEGEWLAEGIEDFSDKVKEAIRKEQVKAKYASKCPPEDVTPTQCARVSPEFRKFLDEKYSTLEDLDEAYADLQEEIEKGDLLAMMAHQQVRSIDGVLKEMDEVFVKDKLYEEMDKTLLGQFINEKAMAAACAAKDDQFTCNTSDSRSPGISNIRAIKRAIDKQSKRVREASKASSK